MKILNKNGLPYSIRVLFVWENRDSKTCENQVESVNKHTRSIFFFGSIPERYRKSSHCGDFKAGHPKRYQNRFFLPLTPFVWESSPPRGGG